MMKARIMMNKKELEIRKQQIIYQIWIVPKKVDTRNKKSTSIYTPLPSQTAKAYCQLNEVA